MTPKTINKKIIKRIFLLTIVSMTAFALLFTVRQVLLSQNLVTANVAIAATTAGPSINPPATIYGSIAPETGFAPVAGMTVTAEISGTDCGETTIQNVSGDWVYAIQVLAEDSFTGLNCGAFGKEVVLRVGGKIVSDTVIWSNLDATHFDLELPFAQEMAVISNQGGLQISWPTHPAICGYDIYRDESPYFTLSQSTFIISSTSGLFIDNAIPPEDHALFYHVEASDCNDNKRSLNEFGLFTFMLSTGHN